MKQIQKATLLITLAILASIAFQDTSETPSEAAAIQHVIVIIQENHSFDNYFGTYPTANGTLLDETTTQLDKVNGIPSNICLSYSTGCLSPRLTSSQEPTNPVEGQTTYEMDYSNNASGFPSHSGPQSMIYFDYHSLAAYWDYAEQYGLADNYFAVALGTTTPNRLMMLTGDTPVSANYGPPPYSAYSATVMNQLDRASVTWGYYDYIDTFGSASNVYPLDYFSGTPPRAVGNARSIDTLIRELDTGRDLPSVSFVNSLGRPELTEHPPYNPTTGEFWIVSIVNKLMESTYWSSTAIFLTWDEGGGYYDHVVPPNEFSTSKNFTSPLIGFGQRVPLLVISPYARTGFVSHVLLSHLSLLHFIEYLWNLAPLNSLVASSNLPVGFFDFSQKPRGPLILTPTVTYPLEQTEAVVSTPPNEIQNGLFLAGLVALSTVIVRTLRPPPQTPRRSHRKKSNDHYGQPRSFAG